VRAAAYVVNINGALGQVPLHTLKVTIVARFQELLDGLGVVALFVAPFAFVAHFFPDSCASCATCGP
jgi:hypothetical protein